MLWKLKERMGQLQDAQKDAEVTSEATERELELEAQLVEARSIIQEQVLFVSFLCKSEIGCTEFFFGLLPRLDEFFDYLLLAYHNAIFFSTFQVKRICY